VCLAVVATGNHFVADIVAGVAVSALGYGLGRAATRITTPQTTVAPAPAPAMG
jgi:hypothetical protein